MCDKNSIIMTYGSAAEWPWVYKSCSPDVKKHVCLLQTPTNVSSSYSNCFSQSVGLSKCSQFVLLYSAALKRMDEQE